MKKCSLGMLCALSLFIPLTHADSFPLSSSTSSEDKMLVPSMKGLLLIPDSSEMTQGEELRSIQGVQAKGLKIPGGLEKLKKNLEPLFLNKPLSQSLLIDLKRRIILYYRAQNRPVITLEIPEQDISSGVIQVIVIEAKVGKIVCKGNRWFSDRLIKSYIDLKPGKLIRSDIVSQNLSTLNKNPFRHTDLFFVKGDKEGTTDVELITKDRFPLRGYIGGDNTGNDATGNARFFAGLTWGNAFLCDQMLTYQFTTSSDFHQFISHTVDYRGPLPWDHSLHIYGGYSQVHPHLSHIDSDFKNFKSHGESSQGSFRYEIPFGKKHFSRLQELLFGFDFKNTNNNLEFIGDDGIPIVTKTVNLSQFYSSYHLGRLTKRQKISLSFELFWSPGEIFPHESDEDYDDLRKGATSKYVYGRLTVGDVYTFPCQYSISGLGRMQVSNQNLLPSEQFGLGGYNTVRGYDEREVNADNAAVINFEMRSKPLSLLKYFKKVKVKDELLFLLFADYGAGINHDALPRQEKCQQLLGVGPGLRYVISPYLSLRIDWGYKVLKTEFNEGAKTKVHIGLIASY